jgi:hypothetical protein
MGKQMQSMVAVPLKYGASNLFTVSKKPYQGSFYNDMAFVIFGINGVLQKSIWKFADLKMSNFQQ